MPGTAEDVKVASSTTKPEDSQSLEGKKASPTSEELLANAKAENARKQEVIESLNTKYENLEAQIAELKVQGGHKQELERLESKQEDVELEINRLRKMPENKAFYSDLDRKIEQAEERGSAKALIVLQEEMINDWAEENSLKFDVFAKELKKFADQDELNPIRKAKNAYKQWKEYRDFKKSKEEVDLAKAKLNGSNEDGTRKARESTLDDAIKGGDIEAQKKHLGL